MDEVERLLKERRGAALGERITICAQWRLGWVRTEGPKKTGKDLAKILIDLFTDLPDLFAFFLVKFTHFEIVDRL